MTLLDAIRETSRIRRRWYGKMMAYQSKEAQGSINASALDAAAPKLVQIESHDAQDTAAASTSTKITREERGDYVKVEFPDETTRIDECMSMIVDHCDDENRLVFGTLASEPLNDYGGQVVLGSELAASFSQIREHRKPTEFSRKSEPLIGLYIG